MARGVKRRKQFSGKQKGYNKSKTKAKHNKIRKTKEYGLGSQSEESSIRKKEEYTNNQNETSSSEDEANSAGELEAPTPYQLLVSSVGNTNKQSQNAEFADDTDSSSEEDGDSSSDEGDMDGVQSESTEDSEDSQEVEENEDEVDLLEEQQSDSEEEDLSEDPFKKHFETDLGEKVTESLLNTNIVWEKSQKKIPYFGKCTLQSVSSLGDKSADFKELNIRKLGVKTKLCNQVAVANTKYTNVTLGKTDVLNNFQKCLFCAINNYQDFYYAERTEAIGEQLRLVYCIHALNHVLKTRSRVLAHNTKLKNKTCGANEEYRDQGLTRPKVLMVLPFRESVKRVVNILTTLLMTEEQCFVSQKKRFMEEFSSVDTEKTGNKPDDFEELFSGNIDDHFRIGLGVAKKSLKLYTDFYSADIILASPLGLRTIIGAEGEGQRDFDFLSSIELLIFDQADVFMMQNWDHILHLMSHLHLQPKESHGADFSRVRMWTLDGLSKFFRQTLIFSSLPSPEINSLFNKFCMNWAGKVMVPRSLTTGTIARIVSSVPQVFKRVAVSSLANAADERFEFFKSKVLPEMRERMGPGTLLFIPSYFDFVRLRNYFRKETIDFVQINEYSKDKNINRARGLFFHGKVVFMMYTERSHFYHRYTLRGIRHLFFYELPTFPNFYSELCNMLQDAKTGSEADHMTCTTLYTKYDAVRLSLVTGSERAHQMLDSEKVVHMFVTGDS